MILFSIGRVRCGLSHKLRLEVFVLVVDAGEGLAVEEAAVPTVVDPGVAVHAHDVGSLVTGLGEPEVTEQISLQIIQFGAILILLNVWNQAIEFRSLFCVFY